MSRDPAWLGALAHAYLNEDLNVDIPLDDDDPRFIDENRYGSVISQIFKLAYDEPEECWSFIKIVCAMPLSEGDIGLLGAGTFEDLMDYHGDAFIERVEAEAKTSDQFRKVVRAAWTESMNEDVARRIEALQV